MSDKSLSNEAKGELASALGAAMKNAGIEVGEDGIPAGGADVLNDKAGEVLQGLLAALMAPSTEGEAPAKVADAPVEADADDAAKTNPFEGVLRKNLESAFADYVDEGTDEDGEQTIDVDGEFVRENGAKLIGDVFAAFAKTLIPKDVSVDVPGPESGSKRKLKLDFSKLFAGLQPPGEGEE